MALGKMRRDPASQSQGGTSLANGGPPGAAEGSRFDATRISVLTGRGNLRNWRLAVILAAVVVVAVLGLEGTSTLQYGLSIGVIYAVAIIGNNAIIASLGEVNLSGGASMAVGAYTVTWTTSHGVSPVAALLLAGLTAGIVGAILAVPTIRISGVATALVTFALAFAIPDLIIAFAPVTGGEPGSSPDTDSSLLGLNLNSSTDVLFLCLAVYLIAAAASTLLQHGSVGRTLIAVGEGGRAAGSFGIRRRVWAVGVWTWAALWGGIAGGLLAFLVGFVTPSVFPILLSITLLVGSFAGGARSAFGALLGGLLVGTIPPEIQFVLPASATTLALGLVLLAVLATGGAGLGGALERVVLAGYKWLRMNR